MNCEFLLRLFVARHFRSGRPSLLGYLRFGGIQPLPYFVACNTSLRSSKSKHHFLANLIEGYLCSKTPFFILSYEFGSLHYCMSKHFLSTRTPSTSPNMKFIFACDYIALLYTQHPNSLIPSLYGHLAFTLPLLYGQY